MADAPYDGHRNGDSAGDKRGQRGSAWRGTTKADDELTMVRLPAGMVREFDAWFESQIPDARQRPSKDPYVARMFRFALDHFKAKFPPVQSLDDRLAQLDGKAS